RPDPPHPQLSWSGWGDPAQAAPLPDGLLSLLREGLGVRAATPPPRSIDALELSPIRLSAEARAELAGIVGGGHAQDDHIARARHARGKSTIDLLRLRVGGVLKAPDLVLAPGSHDEVQAVLECCTRRRIAVVPFGGGTSVVGGLSP